MAEQVCAIDGLGPMPLVQPAGVVELKEVVRQAAAADQALYPVGGQTMINFGSPPTKPGQVIDLRALTQVIDYPARDMTITVQAGLPVARLQEILRAENQQLPIDVPRGREATVGGIVAASVSGYRRLGHGTLRDYLLGLSAVNDQGLEIKGGGRVVKNVAGYDLCKLFVGSLGTLGIITQATLKLRPRPETQAVVILACAAENVGTSLEQLSRSRTQPTGLELLNRAAASVIHQQAGLAPPQDSWELIVVFEGNDDAVKWQVQQLVKEWKRGPLEARLSTTAWPLLEALAELPAWPEATLSLKASLLPSGVAAFCTQAEQVEGVVPLLQAHAGSGIVRGYFGPQLTSAAAAAILARWRELAAVTGGRVVVVGCPVAWKTTLSVWGPPGGDVWLMHAIKDQLDPRRLFNPGRFLDGI